MGTWCPNCMDETKFLAPFYDKYNSKGLEVVALAFERTDDFNKAVSNILTKEVDEIIRIVTSIILNTRNKK